ncbi:putative reverse transcriptase [Hordeum vulgare]|nr:putative reverse transcriptase [Hordeum vulgare]
MGLHERVPRASFFADDAVVLLKPAASDCEVLSALLQLFRDASGLKINFYKSTISGILCSEEQELQASALLGCSRF